MQLFTILEHVNEILFIQTLLHDNARSALALYRSQHPSGPGTKQTTVLPGIPSEIQMTEIWL